MVKGKILTIAQTLIPTVTVTVNRTQTVTLTPTLTLRYCNYSHITDLLIKGETSPATTLFQVKQAVDVIAHFNDEKWWERTSECVGDLVGDPKKEVFGHL